MHEVALATSLVDLVVESAREAGAANVGKVIVEIGALSHVDPHALRFAFETARANTVCATAEMVIEEPPGSAWCMDCDKSVVISARGEACPSCGGSKILVQSGDEMRLKAMEII